MTRRLLRMTMTLLCGCTLLAPLWGRTEAAPRPAGFAHTDDGVFRLHSAEEGISFVIQTNGRVLFLLAALSTLGDDVGQPGGPPCTLDRGDSTHTLPCKVAYVYQEIGIAVLRADATDFPGAFRPLKLTDSMNISLESKLSVFSISEEGAVTETLVSFERRLPPFSFRISFSTVRMGIPVITADGVVGVVTRRSIGQDGISVLSAETIRLALSGEPIFHSLWQPSNP